jgi:hypothetical protein
LWWKSTARSRHSADLERLPADDFESRAIVAQMKNRRSPPRAAGIFQAAALPAPVKSLRPAKAAMRPPPRTIRLKNGGTQQHLIASLLKLLHFK